jgi:hypothetical protein
VTRARALLAVLTLALALPAHAGARDYKWRVSGSLTGTYSNSVSAYNCYSPQATATFSEVMHVNVKFAGRSIFTWQPGRGFGGVLRMLPGGDWRQTGMFPERHVDEISGQESCDSPQPIDCRGKVEADQHRATDAAFGVNPAGRAMRGSFTSFSGVSESAVLRLLPGPVVCNPYRSDGIQMAGPLFGLASSALASSAVDAIIRFPAAKLRGRKAFTYTGPRSKPDPDDCVGDQWLSCTQSGGLVMKLRFTPAKR